MADDVETMAAGSGRWSSARGCSSTEVRNEMKRVTWPTPQEVYATTVVVILTSIVLRHVPLWRSTCVLNALMQWIFRTLWCAA